MTVISALKHSERRAFQCRETFDAEHSTNYGYGRFGAPGDECKVKIDEVGRFLIITSNGMPDHDHSTRNIRPQNIELSIPKHPTLLSVSFLFKYFFVTFLPLKSRLIAFQTHVSSSIFDNFGSSKSIFSQKLIFFKRIMYNSSDNPRSFWPVESI